MHPVLAVTSIQPTSFPSAPTIEGAPKVKRGSESAQVDRTLHDEHRENDSDALSLAGLRRVVEELFRALSNSLQDERESAGECIQRAGAILQVSPVHAALVDTVRATAKMQIAPIRGGLAPWRIRRVTSHIESNLEGTVRTTDLASLVELSAFHFCRAFRDSFGDSPHGYVMRRRVERAQGLMLTTNTSLSQIAIDCGLADQAHFNRLFRRFVGESPGAWRRARADPPPQPRISKEHIGLV
jgi:AraC family transcriptional regulator